MNLDWSATDLAFRDEVRSFLDEKLTAELRQAGRLMTSVYSDHEASMQWQRILHERGWAAPAWPVEYGGCDWSLTQHYIFSRESTLAGAPALSPMGIRMVAHAIMAYGTQEQKEFFLPRILTGEVFFCQGYSEPEAGSDLASLSMAAVDDGDRPGVYRQQDLDDTRRRGELDVRSGAYLAHAAQTTGHHVCADRHDLPGHPDPPAGDDLRRGDPEPGVLRRRPGAQDERGWRDRRRLDRGQVPVGVRTRRRCGRTGAAGDGRGHRYRRRDATGTRRRQAARRPGLRAQARGCADPDRGAGDPRIPNAGDAGRRQKPGRRVVDAQDPGYRAEAGAHRTRPRGGRASWTDISTACDAARRADLRIQPPTDGYVSGQPWQAVAPLHYFNDRAGSIFAGSNEIQRNILAKAALGL